MVEFKQTLLKKTERVLESSGSLSDFPGNPELENMPRKIPGVIKKVRTVSGSIRGWGIN